MEEGKASSPCAFDTLLTKNLPHIFEKIFLSLDYNSFKACLGVSKAWKGLLVSESFRRKAKLVFCREILRDELNLWEASRTGNKDVVRKLLLSGTMNVNSVTLDKMPMLYVAAQKGHRDVVKILIDGGADPNKACRDLQTPLHVAAIQGRRDVVLQLIEGGADPNRVDVFGNTPLHLAVRFGRKSVFKPLIEGGADQHKAVGGGKSPMELAEERGYHDIVNMPPEDQEFTPVQFEWTFGVSLFPGFLLLIMFILFIYFHS